MIKDNDPASTKRIESTRRIHRRAAQMCQAKGVSDEELAVAAIYFAFDLAEAYAGPGMVAIEWLRTSIDVLEQGVLNGVRRPDAKPN